MRSLASQAASIPPDPNADEPDASAVQTVVSRVMEGLGAGRYAPGQRLIARDLALEFNVSRAPVREALHVLAGEGVVDLIPNRGAVVRKLSIKDLVDLMELTEAICTVGVRLATERVALGDNRERIAQSYAEIDRQGEMRQPGPFVVALYEFHNTLNDIGGNTFVRFFYRRTHFSFFNRLLSERLPGIHWDRYRANYARIYETILSGSVHAAEATFVAHMQWAIDLLREGDREAVRK